MNIRYDNILSINFSVLSFRTNFMKYVTCSFLPRISRTIGISVPFVEKYHNIDQTINRCHDRGCSKGPQNLHFFSNVEANVSNREKGNPYTRSSDIWVCQKFTSYKRSQRCYMIIFVPSNGQFTGVPNLTQASRT